MIEDPLPDGDLPHCIGIKQEPVSSSNQQDIDRDAAPQRQQSAGRACDLLGTRHKYRHRNLSLNFSVGIEALEGIILVP